MKFIRSHKLAVSAGVLTLAAVGCAASIASASGGSGTSSTTASTGTRGVGMVTVTVTGPYGRTRTRSRAVSCTLHNGDYILSGARVRDGRFRRAALTIPGYHGAGSYTGTLRASVRGPFLRLQGELQVPVTMTDSGGDVTISRTLPGTFYPQLRGKTVSVSSAWTCTP